MAYVGDVYIPEIKNMPENKGRDVSVIHGINLSNPGTVGHTPGLMRVKVDGILYKPSGTVKTPKQYAEDIRALLRDPSYNYLNYAARTGFLAPTGIPTIDATAPLTQRIPFSFNALFHSAAQFQRRFRSNPEILTNDFSLTFGAGGCDNYIPLPIGATYSGGDGSSITRAGKDGTITLVKANTSNNVNFDLSADEVNVGGCKVWDSVVAGDTNEANWIRVFNKDHKFSGDLYAENGFVRVKLATQANRRYITFAYYANSAWQSFPTSLYIETNGSDGKQTYDKRIVLVSPDNAVVELLNVNDTTKQYIEIIRGAQYFYMYTAGRGATDRTDTVTPWGADSNAFRFAYLPKTSPVLKDGMFDTTSASLTSSDPDNFGLQIDPAKVIVICAASHKVNSGTGGLTIAYSAVTNKYSISSLTTGNNKSIPLYVNIDGADLFKECESISKYGAGTWTDYSGADASPTTGVTGKNTTSQFTGPLFSFVAGTDLPLGTYKVYLRAKDANQITGDCRIVVKNQTDTTYPIIGSSKTLAAAFGYISEDFTLGTGDSGDTIQVYAEKVTATANTITFDYFILIPITFDNKNGPQDMARQALVNQNLVRELIQR